jgi:hypothetical protein
MNIYSHWPEWKVPKLRKEFNHHFIIINIIIIIIYPHIS